MHKPTFVWLCLIDILGNFSMRPSNKLHLIDHLLIHNNWVIIFFKSLHQKIKNLNQLLIVGIYIEPNHWMLDALWSKSFNYILRLLYSTIWFLLTLFFNLSLPTFPQPFTILRITNVSFQLYTLYILIKTYFILLSLPLIFY